MRRIILLQLIMVTVVLNGCGTYVPEIQEFWGSSTETTKKVQAISLQVKCELSNAISGVIRRNLAATGIPKPPPPSLGWLASWSGLVTLNLTVDEKSSVSPAAIFNNVLPNGIVDFANRPSVSVPQLFSLSVGASQSSQAVRIDKVTVYYELKDLIQPELLKELVRRRAIKPAFLKAIHSNDADVMASNRDKWGDTCVPPSNHSADLFIQSDLKLDQWIDAAVFVQFSGVANFAKVPKQPQGVISHDIKFQIVSTGNITPTWKLVKFTSISGTKPLFDTSRDRTQQLIITLAPTEKVSGQPNMISAAGRNSHFAQEIGQAVATAIKPAQ